MIDSGARHGSRARAAAAAALCGTLLACEPPRLAADSAAKRIADRLLPRAGGPAYLYFTGVAALWAGYAHLGGRAGLVLAALAALAGGAWCAVNFWRCRHAHCVVTGAGWLALAGLAAVEAVRGHSLIGGFEGVAFLAVLAAGALFEFGWYLAADRQAVTYPARRRSTAGEVSLVKHHVNTRT